MWHQASGPDVATNGLALCSIHGKLFDHGGVGLQTDLRIQVSRHLIGAHGFSELVMAFHGERLRRRQSDDYMPASEFIDWHQKEVFRSPARDF